MKWINILSVGNIRVTHVLMHDLSKSLCIYHCVETLNITGRWSASSCPCTIVISRTLTAWLLVCFRRCSFQRHTDGSRKMYQVSSSTKLNKAQEE